MMRAIEKIESQIKALQEKLDEIYGAKRLIGEKVVITDSLKIYRHYQELSDLFGMKKWKRGEFAKNGEVFTVIDIEPRHNNGKFDDILAAIRNDSGDEYMISVKGIEAIL